MEFMDDEVLDPVAALSLNLKDGPGRSMLQPLRTWLQENGVSSEGKGIGESTFTFGGGNLAPLPIKVVYQADPQVPFSLLFLGLGWHCKCRLCRSREQGILTRMS